MAPRPLAELLQCPPAIGSLLNASTQSLDLEAGMVVFRQSEICLGLYVLVSGQYLRRAERLETRLTLGTSRAGELVELAAVLGDKRHTYTLSAQTPGSILLLPMEALGRAFKDYPPLRMRLLEELAREVSRGYVASCQNRILRTRQRSTGAGLA
jgi:CRP-like cAMP-binding protein